MRKVPKLNSHDIARDLTRINAENQHKENIHSVEGNLDLSRKALFRNDLFLALYYLDRAIEISSDNPRLITERAKIYFLLKDWKEVADQIQYLLEIDPSNQDAQTAKVLIEKRIDYYKLVNRFPLYS